MAGDVIVQLKMKDRALYDRYQTGFLDVFKKFVKRLLSADQRSSWNRDRLVLMSFPGEAEVCVWAESPAYLEIAKQAPSGACFL